MRVTFAFAAALCLTGCLNLRSAPDETEKFPSADGSVRVEVVATGLDTIWGIAFAPDGRTFLTERPGRIRVLTADGGLEPKPWADVAVHESGESGLLGIALHPDFPEPPHVFVYATQNGAAGPTNRILRYTDEDGKGVDATVLVDGIPAASNHDGGRLAFGPDGFLYATTGDASNQGTAQDPTSLGGKVLRIDTDGRPAPGNAFPASRAYTWGHRNPQGLCWRPDTQELYATEHGPDTDDEVNRLVAGRNYGWPTHRGKDSAAGFEPALYTWTPTIAPAGCAFVLAPGHPWDGDLLLVTLKHKDVRRLTLDEEGSIVHEETLLDDTYGRLRDIVRAPDGSYLASTSNRDGRGLPAQGDDRVLRLTLPS